jgi:D-3-phosphoglycerate dehydrogenase
VCPAAFYACGLRGQQKDTLTEIMKNIRRILTMKCLIIDAVHESITEELGKYMQVDNLYTAEMEGKAANAPLTSEQLKNVIGDYDVLIMRVDPAITEEVLDAAKNLKVIGVCSVGLNHINMDCAKAKGIQVFNAPGLNANAVAELTLSKMLDMSRHTMPANVDVKVNHQWDKYKFVGRELRGRTLGILGFGRIGQLVAGLAHAFKMNIVAYDPFLPDEKFGENNATKMETIEDLLKVADYVTIHMPLLPTTKNLINAKSIATMKPDCIVLNMARGGIVNEQDMYEALKAGKIGGYATDVMVDELSEGADFNSPLFECDNFIVSPHLGAQTVDASRDIGAHIIAKVKEALNLG